MVSLQFSVGVPRGGFSGLGACGDYRFWSPIHAVIVPRVLQEFRLNLQSGAYWKFVAEGTGLISCTADPGHYVHVAARVPDGLEDLFSLDADSVHHALDVVRGENARADVECSVVALMGGVV